MKDTIRCCLSCILPCGALDVVRVVHLDGRVEEFGREIQAGEIMKANPKHVIRKSLYGENVVRSVVVLPPDAELRRGEIYFLMPVASPPKKARVRRKKREMDPEAMTKLLISDRYLSEILSEKALTQRNRRHGRVGMWRPHLESILEAITDS
ncbi:hypothetical protein AMTRI_Chr01g132720 [Amborella trichopoda]|uniref:Uncharacterized protein n=1 Tax=Amborella trichopoda TaxID=13333 RepID=W1Q0Y5_AMBTC|nr:uncharacterized protein LOC18442132 [Amborella trichopoda]ERN13885.1 hypothetical protein AMTR_s00021p00054880 [Amborella trichopoda]|eukprot:XP_006852418.1 uncharacterized protein LOC18442132 [Amborella trichopoda]